MTIRSRLLLALTGVLVGGGVVAADPAGRWEGDAGIPGRPQAVVLDLARNANGAGWHGSVTLPGRGVKGAPLDALAIGADGSVTADLATAFGGPQSPFPTRLELAMRANATLAGSLQQGGHRAELVLRRSGEAQVDAPPRRTPLPAALAGTWRGRYALGGVPREVTLTLGPAGSDGSTTALGELLIVGPRRSQLAVDRVSAASQFLVVEATAAGLRLEGRWDGAAGWFDGTVLQGPFEAPVRLRRDAGSGS